MDCEKGLVIWVMAIVFPEMYFCQHDVKRKRTGEKEQFCNVFFCMSWIKNKVQKNILSKEGPPFWLVIFMALSVEYFNCFKSRNNSSQFIESVSSMVHSLVHMCFKFTVHWWYFSVLSLAARAQLGVWLHALWLYRDPVRTRSCLSSLQLPSLQWNRMHEGECPFLINYKHPSVGR